MTLTGMEILKPVVALAGWTMLMWIWMLPRAFRRCRPVRLTS